MMKFNINHQKKLAAVYEANIFTISASSFSFSCCSNEEEEKEEEEEEKESAKTGKSLTKRRFSSPRK
jgi:hypothetical protein